MTTSFDDILKSGFRPRTKALDYGDDHKYTVQSVNKECSEKLREYGEITQATTDQNATEKEDNKATKAALTAIYSIIIVCMTGDMGKVTDDNINSFMESIDEALAFPLLCTSLILW